jgi:ATP-binding cassette subfamily B protein/subfamily B ATP-binding cassette protein MsbA
MIRRGGKPFVGLSNGIEFRNVFLNYLTDERAAVSGLSFFVPRGGTLALVGESGAGKSSVVDLLLGLFEPTQGEILVDGVSLKDIDGETWRRKIGVVSQDTFLFASSIRENIAFSEPEATEEAIVNAARVAHADEFISELESGYDTQLGDRGFRLSGGQRQRLAMARAFLRDPEVLILDEATSNLDSQSEYLIQRALESFGENRTVVIVAHRLSTVRGADKILVMHQGRLVEQGTHDELVERKGTYAGMWRLQA